MSLIHRCRAVTAGYANLVEAFICLGADVNTWFQCRQSGQDGPCVLHEPGLSPLDLAATLHFPEIVNLLLDHASEVYGGDNYWSHSPLHMIGYHSLPFSRYVAHGRDHRAALQATIRSLLDRGLNINDPDSLGQTPLYIAVKNMDLEPYILEELLAAGAEPGEECNKLEGNIVCSAIICCEMRRHSCWKVRLLLPLLPDINECTYGDSSFNALHLCALLDAVSVADVLLGTQGINIDAQSGRGQTAISLAATRGSLGILALLIHKGADLHLGEPLAAAVSGRQMDAVIMLVDGGADVRVTLSNGVETTILHMGVRTDDRRPSEIRRILAKCPRACTPDVINCTSEYGWTPLHQAAYYGDVDGVAALLEAGADPCKLNLAAESSLEGTPLQLATAIRGQGDDYGVQSYHPRVEREEDEELIQTGRITSKSARRLKACLDEVIIMLRGAESRHPNKSPPPSAGRPPPPHLI
jgi:ankyrin repeat protein